MTTNVGRAAEWPAEITCLDQLQRDLATYKAQAERFAFLAARVEPELASIRNVVGEAMLTLAAVGTALDALEGEMKERLAEIAAGKRG